MKFNVKTYVVVMAIVKYEMATGDDKTFKTTSRLLDIGENSVKTVSLTAEELDLLGEYL